MATYAEGLNILHHANVGNNQHEIDAETTPLRNPEYYQYDLNLADIAEVWRRGSVIASKLIGFDSDRLIDKPQFRRVWWSCIKFWRRAPECERSN
ncbi:hypothetical protein [Nostoc sp. C052]|uniref:hypothetical protein n=1 Tax=Nostoc sp. C052 TaxID=2576902 RepID=UPI0021198811|nr:hypothetical protein [Nostoc sp. C052]